MTDETSGESVVRSESRHRRFWVGLIVTLLGGQIVAMSTMAYVACSDGSFAVEPDYYQKGLHWDDTAAQIRQNAELGWSVRLQVAAPGSGLSGRAVTCELRNQAGEPLDGATVELLAFPHARGNERTAAALSPAGTGTYTKTLEFSRPGMWEFRVAVRRGPETFTQTVLRRVEGS